MSCSLPPTGVAEVYVEAACRYGLTLCTGTWRVTLQSARSPANALLQSLGDRPLVRETSQPGPAGLARADRWFPAKSNRVRLPSSLLLPDRNRLTDFGAGAVSS